MAVGGVCVQRIRRGVLEEESLDWALPDRQVWAGRAETVGVGEVRRSGGAEGVCALPPPYPPPH